MDDLRVSPLVCEGNFFTGKRQRLIQFKRFLTFIFFTQIFVFCHLFNQYGHAAAVGTPSTWTLLAAGERSAIFPQDATGVDNKVLNNGSYFYNLSNFSNLNQGSFGFSPNSTITLDLADIRDSGAGTGQWGLCSEETTGPLRLSWHRRGASGENMHAGYRIGCAIGGAGVRAVYQSNSLPTYYPSGPQRNISNTTLTSGGWTQCYVGDFAANDTYSTLTSACTQAYIILAGYAGSTSVPSLSSFSSTTTSPRNDSNASYSISFSQSVTGLDANDFENAGSATDCSYAISGSGSSYTLSITSCSDGTIQPRLKANSVSGSAYDGPASAATASTSITKDSVAPSTPATPDLADASDSGSSNSDDITNDTTPTINASGTFTGTAKANATKAGSITVSCTISSNACTLGTLSDGIWAISVTESDTAGNAATSLTLTITIDSTAPSTPTITSQTVSDKESIAIQVSDTGTAFLNRWTLVSTTPTSATSITSTNTEFWNSVSVSADSATQISTVSLGTGYNYKLYVVDVAGNISSGSSNLVKVDPASSPTISTATRPTSSSPLDKVGSTLTNVMSVSGLPAPTVVYQYVRCPSVSGDWVPTCVNIPGATSSTYTMTTDDAGQHIGIRITATNSEGTAVQLGVATASVGAGVPGSPTSVTATITGSTTATVSFTAPSSNGGSSITGYTITSTPLGATCSVGANSTTYNCTGLSANTAYTFTVKATNSAGTGSDSVASSSTTTEVNPTVSISLEGSLTVLPISVPARIYATTTKPGTVSFSKGGTNLNQCANIQADVSGSNYIATCTWTPALNINGHGGQQSIVATFTPTNSGYRISSDTKTVEVTNIGGNSFTAPSITNVVASGGSVSVYFTVGSPALGPNGYSNSASWINFQYSLDGGTSWNENGTHYYLTSNGDWRTFNASPSPLVITGLSQQTYNIQIREQIYHAPGSAPNTYWLVAPSVSSPYVGGGSQSYSVTLTPLSASTSVASKSLTAGSAATSFTPITTSGGGSAKTYSINPPLRRHLALRPLIRFQLTMVQRPLVRLSHWP